MLEPEVREKLHGHAEVRQVFKVSKVGNIAGCLVTDGHIQRGSKIRLTRGGIVITEDLAIETLTRLKDDVKEVKSRPRMRHQARRLRRHQGRRRPRGVHPGDDSADAVGAVAVAVVSGQMAEMRTCRLCLLPLPTTAYWLLSSTMTVGVLQLELSIPDAMSLKDKRRVVKSLKDRIAHGHNVSIAEVGALDEHRRSILGIAMVGNDAATSKAR